ncbi:MAG: hypothetical protein HFI75_08590 [Lachnospiraceae bacterium]|nr:hypothetical protein [Lachnospiraceae bacterium]
MWKSISKHGILFVAGGILYVLIELFWRGYSHWSMFFIGGLCFFLIGLLNEVFPWNMPLCLQGLAGATVITVAELAFGYLVNIRLGWQIWDYSDMPLNLMGQICVPFSLLWILVSIAAVITDDWIRYRIFNEKLPTYRLF